MVRSQLEVWRRGLHKRRRRSVRWIRAPGGFRAQGPSEFLLGDEVRVVSDAFNNSLLVYATPYEYQKIERILQKLDVVVTQVLIEASIVEVTLIDDLEFGLEWAFDNNLGGGDTGSGLLDLGGGLGRRQGFRTPSPTARGPRQPF